MYNVARNKHDDDKIRVFLKLLLKRTTEAAQRTRSIVYFVTPEWKIAGAVAVTVTSDFGPVLDHGNSQVEFLFQEVSGYWHTWSKGAPCHRLNCSPLKYRCYYYCLLAIASTIIGQVW